MIREKCFTIILLAFLPILVKAQYAVHNFGDFKVHGEYPIGLHLDFINDGNFDQDLGLVGFYSIDSNLEISGTVAPYFFDVEFQVDSGLMLHNEVKVKNNANIISGNIYTERTNLSTQISFMNDAFYIGETDLSKVDGFAAVMNKEVFTFPVGNQDRLRPLTIESAALNPMSKCAYFFENPNNSAILSKNFSTQNKDSKYLSISKVEFWILEGGMPSKITLTWDELSDISSLGDYLSDLKVVGWDKSSQMWINLGNTRVEGDIYRGRVTSDFFIPDQYEILAIGGKNELMETFETIKLDNYFLTPNGDGTNDFLVIEGIENSTQNSIQIFNRYGQLVYSKENYAGEFNGTSNVNLVVERPKGLEPGIYFYICTFYDLQQKHQGYLYLNN